MQLSDLINIIKTHGSVLVDCHSRIMSNLFFELGLDTGLVWIILSGEETFLPVVTCGIVFTEHGDMKMLRWKMDKDNWSDYNFRNDQPPR